MLEKTIFLIVSLCFSFAAFSQPTITIGEPYEVINGQGKFYFYSDNELLTVKKDEGLLYMQKLNTASLSYERMSLNKPGISETGFEFIKVINNRYFLFYSDRRGLLVREIDFKLGDFKDQARRIISAERVVGNSTTFGPYGIPEKASSKYAIYISNDESRVVIQYRIRPEIRDDSKSYETIGLHIFDNNLQEVSSSILRMPYTEMKMNNLAYSVDSKGNAYIVTSVYDDDTTDEKKKNSSKPNYHLEILKVTPPSVNFTSTRVDLEGNFVKTIKLYENPKGFMTCIGFYNKGKKADNVDGIIQFKLSTDGKLSDFKTYEIPLQILNQYVDDLAKAKNSRNEAASGAELEDLALREVTFNKDGSMLIISEQKDKDISYGYDPVIIDASGPPGVPGAAGTPGTYGGNGGPTTRTRYSDRDILVTKIDSASQISWMKKLPKGRVSGSVSESFYYLPGNGVHHFLFLDNMKNFNLPKSQRHSTNHGWGDILMTYSVNDETGKVKKTAILDLRKVEGIHVHQFTPSRIEAIAPSIFVFEGYIKNDEDVLIKVDLSKL